MKKYTLKMTLETQSHCAGELILFKPQEKFLQLVEQQLYSSSVILCFYVMLRTENISIELAFTDPSSFVGITRGFC